jgi:carbamoyl-phosphate synthase large subunit
MAPLPSGAGSPGILFTSVGRRVELLRAFRRAYQELGLLSRTVAIDIDPLAPALRVADRCRLVPSLDDSDYIPTLVDICHEEDVRLVFPLIDPDIPVLTRHEAEIEATGARIATVSSEAAALTADKLLTEQFFKRLGLRTPRSWLPDETDFDGIEYPLFIKSRSGSAGKDAFPARNARELRFFLEYVPDPIVQEFLPGPEITCDVICGLDGSVLAVVARQRIEVRCGEVAKGITVHDSRVIDACVKIAQCLPARGPITVQCMLKDGEPYFTEINTRFGGGFPLALAAGVDAPLWYVAQAAGVQVPIPPIGSYQVGLYLTRCDESYFLTEVEHAQMARHSLRSR